jgi:alginate O-acetyltransferase complex protein AlgJ
MQFILRKMRYVLPVVFFSYSAVVNFGFAEFPGHNDVALDRTALTGALTAKMDEIYRHSLPHREPAIGVMGALRYLAVGEARKGALTGKEGWLFTDEEVRPMADAMPLKEIVRLRDQMAEAGVTLVMVPVPGKLDVYAANATEEEAAGISALYDEFRAGLAAEGIMAVDARAALREVAAKGPAFFRTDTHWTTEGAAAVAEAVKTSGFVPMGEAAFAIEDGAKESFVGDLVTYVTTDNIAPYIGFSPEEAVPYTAVAEGGTAVTGADIFAGATAGGTVLVGTSYSANPTWSFAEALKVSLQADILNHAEEGQGPVKPLLTYLASDEFRDAPPAVVIWEFPVRYLTDPEIWNPKDDAEGKSGA